MKTNILAVDTGLTGCKALIFDREGNILSESQATTPVQSGNNGSSQIDMTELWNIVCKVIRSAVKHIPYGTESIGCIGFSGHGNGAYFIDSEGNPAGMAVSSMDTQAAPDLDSLEERNCRQLQKLSLQQLWPGQPGIILRRIKREHPEDYKRIDKVLFCKDYLSFRLSGVATTDYSDASASGLLNNQTGKYDPQIMEALGISDAWKKLPPVIRGYDIRGTVSKEGASDSGLNEGTPVIGGMFDVDSCIYGCGALSNGQTCSIAGTWNINTVISDSMQYSDKIRQCILRTDGLTPLLIDSSATSATNINWYVKTLLGSDGKEDFNAFDDELAAHDYSESSPYFLPFVNGALGTNAEQGAFLGLNMLSDQKALFAAVCEGVCFAHRWHLENLQALTENIKTVRLTGGAARGKQFRQLIADVCGVTIEKVNTEQTGALGIWAAASCAMNNFSDMKEVINSRVKISGTQKPDNKKHELFDRRYLKFKEMIQCHL